MAWKLLPQSGWLQATNEWVYDNNYKSWFYLKSDGSYANQECYGKYYLKNGWATAREWFYDTIIRAGFT